MSQTFLCLLSTGAINSVYGTFGISLLIIVFIQSMKNRRINMGAFQYPSLWVFFAFGLAYCIIGDLTIQGMLYYCITPVLAYCAGWSIIETEDCNKEKGIRNAMLSIIIGYAVHAFLNYILNRNVVIRSQLRDVYSGAIKAATGSGAINTLSFSLIAYFLVIEKKRIVKAIGVITFVISLAYAFVLGTRTQFIILAITSIVILAVYMIEKKGLIAGVALFFFTGIILACVWLVIYEFELFGLKEFIESSNLANRNIEGSGLEEADQYRFESIFRGFENLLVYPFGVPDGLTTYYHNMWLDVGRISGLLPFILVVLFTVASLYRVLRLLGNKRIGIEIRYMLFSVYIGFYVNFAVEPVLEGLKDFFYVFCIVNGMTECFYYTKMYYRK